MSSTAHILETAETLLRYREEEFLCDTAIITSDRQIKAHSVLLAAVSPVFREAFGTSASSSGMYQVDLQSVESHILETALDFIYTGQLIVPSPEHATQDQLSSLFSTLQDLGLDVNKLNGCEIKYKSEMKQKLKSAVAKPKEASTVAKKQTISQTAKVKNELQDSDTPLKPTEHSLGVTPFKKHKNEVKWKASDLEKDDDLEESADQIEANPPNSDTAEGINGAVDDTEMDDEEGEHCLLVEGEGDEPKYYFMLVPNNGGVTSGVKSKIVKSNSFDCDTCDESFPDKRNLMSHVKSSHLCDVCGHAFPSKSALEDHLLTAHSIEEPESKAAATFHCSACGELFEGEEKIREHLETSPECTSADNPSVQVTMLASVDSRRPFLCDTCGKNFSSALSLRMHSKLHSGDRPFSCTKCGKSFVQKVQLLQHEQRHLGIRPYACDLCDRTFSQKGQLTLHTRLHTGERPFVCEFCNASYVSRPLLTQHRRLHTGERPHVCATCSKNFAHKESLIVHMRTHTGEKPFECTICGNRYTQSHHLKGHMRTHTGEKPFACHLCDKTYKNRVDLRFHCTRVHGIDISKRKTKPMVIVAEMTETDSQ